MVWVMALLTFVAGAANTVQSGCNAALSKALGQPLFAGFVIAAISATVYVAFAPLLGLTVPQARNITQVPWWAWLGGLCGGASILCTIFFAEPLGSGVFTGLVVTASVITSVALDNFGILGFHERPLTLWRALGCVVMLLGLSLVAAF